MTTRPQTDGSFYDRSIVLKDHSDVVNSVVFSPSSQWLASASSDNTLRLWKAETGASVKTLNDHKGTVRAVVFSPDNAILASAADDKKIILWDVESQTEMATLLGHTAAVWSLAFSPDGAMLVSGSSDKTIRIWNVKSRETLGTLSGHEDRVWSVKFSPDGKRLASGSEDNTARIWDATSKTTITTLRNHTNTIYSVEFSPDGKYLASASNDTTVVLWDATTHALVSKLRHGRGVNSVSFSPNGQHLASGCDDSKIWIWDVASRALVTKIEGHSSMVASVSFSHDGARLASGSYDRTVRVLSLIGKYPPRPNESIPTIEQNAPLPTQERQGRVEEEISPSTPTVRLNNDITSHVTFEESAQIGLGGFGDVFLGSHRDHGKVALKRPHRLFDDAAARRFLREIDLWCSVSSRYILPCLGMCKFGPQVYVVSPYIENGDLLSCMARGMALNRSKLLYEIAEALTHLHYKGIVHGDVKAQNVLISNDGSALLCDFGLAKAFDTMVTSTESKGSGSVRWMAPELCLGESRTMASDVYSLGITIAEVLSGRTPYLNISDSLAVMFHVVYHDGRPPMEPLGSPEGKSYATLWETAEKCWVKDAKSRPYMAQVLAMLFPITRETS